MESFHSVLKKEEIYLKHYSSFAFIFILRACLVSWRTQIFEGIFADFKAKIRRHTGVWQEFLTQKPTKFTEKTCGKDAEQALIFILTRIPISASEILHNTRSIDYTIFEWNDDP